MHAPTVSSELVARQDELDDVAREQTALCVRLLYSCLPLLLVQRCTSNDAECFWHLRHCFHSCCHHHNPPLLQQTKTTTSQRRQARPRRRPGHA